MSLQWIRNLFCLAALYDIVLGAVFFAFYRPLFDRFGATLPNHPGYAQLPALLVLVFGIGFAYVASDPQRNRAIITLGILMKLAFAGVVIGHSLLGTPVSLLMPLAIVDVAFALLFVWAQASLAPGQEPTGSRQPVVAP